MTPIEKAVIIGRHRENLMRINDRAFCDADARAVIRAFLEAAAEDERVLKAAYLAYSDSDAETCVQDMAAAILALKETLK